MDSSAQAGKTISSSARNTIKVVVVTTAMFTFISYWRAAAVVISDIGSTAFYISGIVEQAIGKAAPYFIAMVMVFSLLVRSVYIESCGMFTRGGVYRVVKEALGGNFAKISVSALMFDYILTGPISSVSAGQYFIGLLNDTFKHLHFPVVLPHDAGSMIFAIAVTLYFWWLNIKGIEESSDRAFQIMVITGIMGVIIIVWGVITYIHKPVPLPPFELHFHPGSLGWLKDFDWAKSFGVFGIMIAFGHSLLAMSGEESLAQVNREIEYPKLKNLKKAALIIFIFSFILTVSVAFLGVMLIPDSERMVYIDNMISGLTMNLMGPDIVKLIFQAFVVLVGALILAGAVNTSIIGANGVLNRLAEDRVLTGWFKKPQKKFGTTHRIITLIGVLQVLTIILSRGDVYVLGEAYAFGVIWSFTFNTFSMLVLRYKDKRPRAYKVPVNFKIGKTEIPVGLITIFLILAAIAVLNLFTKEVATISGVIFTAVFFTVFYFSERINKKKFTKEQLEYVKHLEDFNLHEEIRITPESIGSKKGYRKLVAVRSPSNLYHLDKVLAETDTDEIDIIVMTSRVYADKTNMQVEVTMDNYERELMTEVLNIAEHLGKSVIPLVVPTNNAFYSILNTANELKIDEVIMGLSARFKPDVQLEQLSLLWGTIQSDESKKMIVRVIAPDVEFKVEL